MIKNTNSKMTTNSQLSATEPKKKMQSENLFRMVGQIKCFPDKVKFKGFIITTFLLYEI